MIRSTFAVTDCYREAASILLLRPGENGGWDDFEVFLIHKPRKKDAWQLPQGGKEAGETDEQCAVRELKEEAGISGVQVLAVSKEVYKYDFPKSYRRFRPDNICGQKIAFVIGTVDRNAQHALDGVEVNDCVWVQPKGMGKYVRRKEYFALVKGLIDEARELLHA